METFINNFAQVGEEDLGFCDLSTFGSVHGSVREEGWELKKQISKTSFADSRQISPC